MVAWGQVCTVRVIRFTGVCTPSRCSLILLVWLLRHGVQMLFGTAQYRWMTTYALEVRIVCSVLYFFLLSTLQSHTRNCARAQHCVTAGGPYRATGHE
jgi:hypothetical protein